MEITLVSLLLEFHQPNRVLSAQLEENLLDLGVLERLDFESISLQTKLSYVRILKCLVRGFMKKGLGLDSFPEQVKMNLRRVQRWQESPSNALFQKCHELLKEIQVHSVSQSRGAEVGEGA